MLMVPSADKHRDPVGCHVRRRANAAWAAHETKDGREKISSWSPDGDSLYLSLSFSLILPERFRGRESEKELEVLRLTRVSAFQTSKREAYAVMST